MRYTTDPNGNGCKCDICGRMLLPTMAYKLKISTLNDDKEKARSGYYTVRFSKDLCSDCYNKIIKMFNKKENLND